MRDTTERPPPRTPFAESLRSLRQRWNERHPLDPRPMRQERLAEELDVAARTVREWESGRTVPRTPAMAQRICDVLEAPREALTIGSPAVLHWVGGGRLRSTRPVSTKQPGGSGELDDAVAADQQRWRLVRRYLNENRGELARAAARLYRADERVLGTAYIAPPAWIPERPVPLERIALRWVDREPSPAVVGHEPEAQGCLPARTVDRSFSLYSTAIRYLQAPTLFENRPSYRLVDVSWGADAGTLSFTGSTYFDKLNVSECLGHEFAAAWLEVLRMNPDTAPDVGWPRLPYRRVVRDPFDLSWRAVIPGIATLTLVHDRHTGQVNFLLHWRDPAKVATSGGVYSIIPAGEFQPASVGHSGCGEDFDLWRNIVREYSEELLGMPEHDGSRSDRIDYQRWPLYRRLQQARSEQRLRISCIGIGCNALTLTATITVIAVFDAEDFAEVFGGLVHANTEGLVVSSAPGDAGGGIGLPFTSATVERFLESEPMAPTGAACLALAWQHREHLLADPPPPAAPERQ